MGQHIPKSAISKVGRKGHVMADRGLLDDVTGWLKNKTDEAKDEIGDITGDVAENLLEKFHISQWYSVHLTSFCEGNFGSDQNMRGASFNVTKCTRSGPSRKSRLTSFEPHQLTRRILDLFNLTGVLDHNLQLGDIQLNFADLKWPTSVTNQLNKINDLVLCLFIAYLLHASFAAFSLIGSLGAFFWPNTPVYFELIVASLSAISGIVGSCTVTYISGKAVGTLNDIGAKVDLSARAGRKFLQISWAATVLMINVTGYWAWLFYINRRQMRR